MLILGWIAVIFIVLIAVFNATIMLISPRAWFNLPSWLGFQGTLSRNKYDHGFGALEIRIGGALMLAVFFWTVYDYFKS